MQLIGTAPYVLSTNPQKPFKTFLDVVATAKTRRGTVSYATIGAGSIGHLVMELLWKQAGVRLVHVPYRGGGPASNDLIAGHVDLMIASTAQSIPQIQAHLIGALAQTGKTRTSMLADVPTIGESYAGFEAYAWWGLFAPAYSPPLARRVFSVSRTVPRRSKKPIFRDFSRVPAMPVIGLLSGTDREATSQLDAIWQGLNKAGYVEGRNVAMEYLGPRVSWTDCQRWRLIWFAAQ